MTWYEWFVSSVLHTLWLPLGGLYLELTHYFPAIETLEWGTTFDVWQSTNAAQPRFLPIVVKLCFCLAVLIVIRGGVPRFRYDLLTKMGWTKFLLYVLAFFLMTLCIYLV